MDKPKGIREEIEALEHKLYFEEEKSIMSESHHGFGQVVMIIFIVEWLDSNDKRHYEECSDMGYILGKWMSMTGRKDIKNLHVGAYLRK